jgi:SAM-dependent methyltransferase
MQYQTFPDVNGNSKSLDKLKALRLPDLTGKRFLDVGCNEGFFCGYAHFDGASEVIGIDKSNEAVSRARVRFPECQFSAQSWDQLPEGKFDVILMASALHYAEDQAALIHRLMDSLTDAGILVLEIGIAPSGNNEWVPVKRSIDERLFPTRKKLAEVLNDYAWKIVGYSVQQAGDPLQRYVVHIRRMQPYVFLLIETPGSGKSTLARTLFTKAQVPVVSGDATYREIFEGRLPAPEALKEVIRKDFSSGGFDKAAERVFSQDLFVEMVDVWCLQGGESGFALDSYVPEKYQQSVRNAFLDKGYLPISMTWDMDKSMSGPADADNKAELYAESLIRGPDESAVRTLRVTRLNSPALSRFFAGWHLDHPVDGQIFIDNAKVTISGWGLPQTETTVGFHGYVRSAGGFQLFKPDKHRPDVIKAFRKDAVDLPEEALQCGFRLTLSSEEIASGVEFGFVLNGDEVPAAHLGLAEKKPEGKSSFKKLFKKLGTVVRPST